MAAADSRAPVLWVRPPSQWLAACKTNLKAGEWHLGACKHAGRPKIFAEVHTVRRTKGHYVNAWAPSSWGIFKVASAPRIKPAKKQRHSFKSSMQEPRHNFLAPEGRLRKGPQPRVPCFFSTARRTGWFCDSLQYQLSGWADMISFLPFGKERLFWKMLKRQPQLVMEHGEHETEVAITQAWQKKTKTWDGFCFKPQI